MLVSLIMRQWMRHNWKVTFLLPKSSTKIWRIVSLLTPHSSAIILTVAQRSSYIRSLTFAMSPSLRTENGRRGLASSSILSTPLSNRTYHLNICARDKEISPYTSHHFHSLSCSSPKFKTEYNVHSLLHAATMTTSSHYLHNMAPYFPSCSAWGVAVLPDYRRSLGTWMACIAS